MMNRLRIVLTAVLAACALMLGLAACSKEGGVKATFVVAGGASTTVTAEAGKQFTAPSPEPEEGYVFDGWYLTPDHTGEKQTPTVMPEEDTTYYGRFLKQSTLTLSGLATEDRSYAVAEGTPLSSFLADKEPVREGYLFGGWFTGNVALASGAVMGGEDLTLTARWKVEYTVRAYYQNKAGVYPQTPTEETLVAWEGETVSPADLVFDHFTVDEDKTDLTPFTAQKGASCELWLARNVYHIYYRANAPEGLEAAGNTPTTDAYYDTVANVAENGFRVKGYRFAGWMESADGALSESYTAGAGAEIVGNVVLYAKWDKGYTDRFGGGDYIFLPEGSTTVYLGREGLEEKEGTYDPETRVFVFTTDAGEELKGRLSPDGTFAYYGDENPGTYRLVDAFTSREIAEKPWELILDEYDGATLVISESEQYTGYYTADAVSGDFLFTGDEGTPEAYASFYFYLGTYGVESKNGFAIRGEEYGTYGAFDSAGNLTALAVLDGYGMVYFLSSTTETAGTYAFTEDFEETQELEVHLYEQVDGEYVLGNDVWKLLGDVELVNGTIMGMFAIRDDFFGDFTLEGGGTLSMDGYGNGTLATSAGTRAGTYTQDGAVLLFEYEEGRVQHTLLFSYDLETAALKADVGAEYGTYYLYNVKEKTLYTTTLQLDGLGGASWYTFRRETGSYTYDEATHIVTCTNSDGEVHFLLFTYELNMTTYKAYQEEVLLTYPNNSEKDVYTGTLTNGSDTIVLDGYRAAYRGGSYYYTLESRSGFTGMVFVTLLGANDGNDVTFLVGEDRTYSETLAEIGKYSHYLFSESFGGYAMVAAPDGYEYSLKINNDATAELIRKKSWEPNGTTVFTGTVAHKEGSLYTFRVATSTLLGYESGFEFEFMLSSTGNGTRVFITYDARVAIDLHTEDGTETLKGDGYGNLTYSVNGRELMTARFEIDDGRYVLKVTGDEKYEFNVVDAEEGIMVRAAQEARLYTLYDPSGKEELRIILDGNGHAQLRRRETDSEGFGTWGDTFVAGTYARTERAGEWEFVSESEKIYPSFRFILPEDAPYIAFMKYDPEADGRFDADNWAILVLDGYFGYYTGASFIDANGGVHVGYYSNDGKIVVFEDAATGASFNLKLLTENSFKRLGDEMGTYQGYDPIYGTVYAYPQITLDGEGGATLDLTGSTNKLEGTYAPYGDAADEFVFTYREGGNAVEMRFRISVSGTVRTFLVHADAMDGKFGVAETGTLEVDGYSGAVYVDGEGKRYEGYYLSYSEVPMSEGKGYLVIFMGLVEGGSSRNDDDILITQFLIDHTDHSLRETALYAGSYGKYSPRMGLDDDTALFMDGLGVAYLGHYEDGEVTWQKGTYTFDEETAEGTYTIGGAEQNFVLMAFESYNTSYIYFVPFEEEVAGEFTCGEERLVLDGYGGGTYYEMAENGVVVEHTGACYFYFSDYITDYTVVLQDYVTGEEFYFKIYRDASGQATAFKAAGAEVNDYYTCVVGSSGASVGYNEILTLDGDGKAELRKYTQDENFHYIFDGIVLGTYSEKAREEDDEGNVTITWTFTPNEAGMTGFDFQIRYIQMPFSYQYVPCFIKYDANYATTYSCETDEGTATLALDGYEQATYTDAAGTVYTGVYYRSGDKIYFTAYLDSAHPKAVFTVDVAAKTFTIDTDLN